MFPVSSMPPTTCLVPGDHPVTYRAVPVLTLGTLTEYGAKNIKSEGSFLTLDHQVSYRITTHCTLKQTLKQVGHSPYEAWASAPARAPGLETRSPGNSE